MTPHDTDMSEITDMRVDLLPEVSAFEATRTNVARELERVQSLYDHESCSERRGMMAYVIAHLMAARDAAEELCNA